MQEAATAAPGLMELFMGFLTVGLLGFGGVLPWARRMIVEQRRWMTAAEFTDLLALCQFLPGPNVINVSAALGLRFQGIAGAVACFVGLMAAPMAVVIALGAVFARYAEVPEVRRTFAGLAAGASALVLATAIKIAAPLRGRIDGILVALATLAAVAWLRLPMLPVLLVIGPVAIALAWALRIGQSDAARRR
ncbi:MAG: chromate transporter [Proteobacteria bacterium]|nr:chromate transporter [Pseudomonadota bacterium]